MFNTLKKSSLTLLIASTALFQFGCGSSSDPDLVGNWYKKDVPSFGGIPRYGAVSFMINNKGYIGTGYTRESVPRVKDFWQYDADGKIWSQVAEFTGAARNDAVSFVAGGKAYVGTGYDGVTTVDNGYKKDFWQYDPTTNKWKAVADFAGVPRQYASAFSIGDKGYVGLGYNASGVYQDFYEYNVASNTWSERATFTGGKRRGANAFTLGGIAYVGFGQNNSSVNTKDLYQFDPAGNSGKGAWTKLEDTNDELTARAFGFTLIINEKAYIIGGSGASDVWEYTPGTNTWVSVTAFEGGSRSYGSGFTIGNIGYFGTGVSGTNLDDFWAFDPTAVVNADDNN